MFIELTHVLWNEPSKLTKNNTKSCNYYLLYLYSISPNFDIFKTYNIIFKIIYLTIIKQNIEKRDIPKEKIITRRKYIQLMQCPFCRILLNLCQLYLIIMSIYPSTANVLLGSFIITILNKPNTFVKYHK